MVNELVFRATNAVEEGLNNAPLEALGFKLDNASHMSEDLRREALQESKQMEIDNGIVQLETLLNATVDKTFDKFEIYTLRNILSVGHEEEELAPWVRLEHYKSLELNITTDAPTPEQVQLQRRKLHETTKLNTMLKAEEAKNQAVLSRLRSLTGDGQNNTDNGAPSPASPYAFLSSLQQSGKASTQQPFNQNVQYTVQQLPALRDLLAKLKDSLQKIPSARHATSDDNSVEAKRRQYVETQSRRALERRGLDLEDPAAMGAVGAGRKIGGDEVEGIEAVVHALGGAQHARRSDDDDMEE